MLIGGIGTLEGFDLAKMIVLKRLEGGKPPELPGGH
jgi:hypothetical protein